MDPNVALSLLAAALDRDDRERVMEQVEAIAGWLAGGGFAASPESWRAVYAACGRALARYDACGPLEPATDD